MDYSDPMFTLTLLETELPIPAWGFGVITFVIFLALLAICLNVGKNRFHS